MSIILRAAFALVLMTATGASAFAEAPEDDSGLRYNCAGDYFRFCSGYMPGSAAIKSCFIQNFRVLTPACQAAIRSYDRRNPRRS